MTSTPSHANDPVDPPTRGLGRKLREKFHEWGVLSRTISGIGLLGAIVAIGTLSGHIENVRSATAWIGRHPAITTALVATLILIDNLRLRFSRQGSATEHHRHRTVEEQRVKYLAFISTSSGEESFYSLIFNHFVQSARALSDSETRLILIPWFPNQSFNTGKELRDDVRALQRVNNFQFSGLFVIPDDPDTDVGDLRLLREVTDNIIFLDVNFDPDDRPDDWDPCFVGGDEVRGANLAADIAVDYLRAVAVESPRVLVIVGRSTRWESQRYTSFEAAVIEAIPDADVTLSDHELMYSREKARDYVYGRLKRGATQSNLPHVIFACNDDMAIGAHDAVRRLLRSNAFDDSAAPRIVGYDGIREMVDLINGGDELILGTVDVSIKQLAYHAMENMKHMIEGSATVYRDPPMRPIRAMAHPRPTGGAAQ